MKKDWIFKALTLPTSSALMRTNSFLLCEPAISLPLVLSITKKSTSKQERQTDPLHSSTYPEPHYITHQEKWILEHPIQETTTPFPPFS